MPRHSWQRRAGTEAGAQTTIAVPLMPMTSAAFIIFTLYMIPDPATTPLKPARQALFGLAVAAAYGVIRALHLVFGLFYALLVVAAILGLSLHVLDLWRKMRERAVGPGAGAERLELRPD